MTDDKPWRPTEYLLRSSSTFLKLLFRYDWMRSRIYGSCSMYKLNVAFSNNRDLIDDRGNVASAQSAV